MDSNSRKTKKEMYINGEVKPVQVWISSETNNNCYGALMHLAKMDGRSMTNYCARILEEHAKVNAPSYLNK